MALVKKSSLAGHTHPAAAKTPVRPAETPHAPKPKQPRQKTQSAGERIAKATQELASGVAESAAAAEELRRALEQIAAAAEEAAGASHESLGAITNLSALFAQARVRAEESRRRSDEINASLVEIARQIDSSIEAIRANAKRQLDAVHVVSGLGKSAVDVGQISATVTDIAEQTNLLALNAAIEASRASDSGRGFTIVADEVRALAVTAESRAQEVTRHEDVMLVPAVNERSS